MHFLDIISDDAGILFLLPRLGPLLELSIATNFVHQQKDI